MKQTLFLERDGQVQSIETDHTVTVTEDPNGWADIVCSIRFRLEGEERIVTDQSTEDCIQKIENILPDGWHVHTCASCGHGHYCPYGNADNEIICVTDFQPKEQSDLWPLFETEDFGHSRCRSLFHCCDSFTRPGSEEYWYNDFKYREDAD